MEKQLGISMADTLGHLIQPYFLRREKKQVFSTDGKENSNPGEKKLELTVRKNDFVVWLPITSQQSQLYSGFLQTPEVNSVRST
jgi:hypothetical protein